MKVAARIDQCGCLMEWVRERVVRITPCPDPMCDAMLDPRPGRQRVPVVCVVPEEES